MVDIKKAVSCIMFTVLAVSCLSGCGGEFTDETGKPGGDVSGGAVSGGAVSGGAVKAKKAVEDVSANGPFDSFFSGNCVYFMKEGSSLAQITLKDGKEKDYTIYNLNELLYVGEDELIYWGATEDDKETFYTVPIIPGPGGTEELKTASAKQISGVPDDLDYLSAVYADGQYIIYTRAGATEVQCYNRETGRTSQMPMPGEVKELVGDGIAVMKRVGERLYFWMLTDSILCWQMDEDKVYYYDTNGYIVEEYTKGGVLGIEQTNNNEEAVVIDVVGQKKTTVISEGEVDRLLKREFGDVRYWGMADLYLDGGRIYALVGVEWVKDKTCYTHCVVLSRESDGNGELKYERELIKELMAEERRSGEVEESSLKKIQDDKGLCMIDTSGVEKVQYYDGVCSILNGKAYFSVDELGKKITASYDLKTGTCETVKWGDWEYLAADLLLS